MRKSISVGRSAPPKNNALASMMSASMTQPWVQNNPSSSEALTFTGGAYNTNYNGFDGKHVAFNSLACASQASVNPVATWITDQQTTISSFVTPVTEVNGSQMASNGHQLGGFLHN